CRDVYAESRQQHGRCHLTSGERAWAAIFSSKAKRAAVVGDPFGAAPRASMCTISTIVQVRNRSDGGVTCRNMVRSCFREERQPQDTASATLTTIPQELRAEERSRRTGRALGQPLERCA